MLLLFTKGFQNRKCLTQTINLKHTAVSGVPPAFCTVVRGLLPLFHTGLAANDAFATQHEDWLLNEL